jgi:DMSO reductase family type II enzyme heme b subunit
MKSPVRSILVFMTPLLLLGVLYFLLMHDMSEPQTQLPPGEDPLTVRYASSVIPAHPTGEFWRAIEPVKIRLYPQTPRVPFGTEERDLWVRGMFNDEEIAFLLEFEDDTEDRRSSAIPDGCAIMLTPTQQPATVQMMGHGDAANIWHWLADRDADRYQDGADSVNVVAELIATGPGTQTPLAGQHVAGEGRYVDGRWYVVFKRQLKSLEEGELALSPDGPRQISFAVWDGSLMESFSRKSIAILRDFRMERGQ